MEQGVLEELPAGMMLLSRDTGGACARLGLVMAFDLEAYEYTPGGFIAPEQVKDLPDGQKPSACIGCGACMWNCPYGEISFSKTKGVTQKCDSCCERREQGLDPICVDACPTKSIKFMELEETMADLPFLPDSSKTKPCLFVKPSKRAKEVMAND